MKTFTTAQEDTLRELILDLLVDSGYAPRSTKSSSRPAARPESAPREASTTAAWPADDEVLLDEVRVCRALHIRRSKLYKIVLAERRKPAAKRRLRPVRTGRKLLFRPKDVLAYIDSLAEAA